jgi:protein-S-isoprenylcysteine O-methyltransferase Ste14
MFELMKWAMFVLFSIACIVFSWESLQRVRSHGFYMFFAFEAILGLIIINLEYWFIDVLAPLQILSWFLLCTGIITVIAGYYPLMTKKKPQPVRNQSQAVIKTGIYKYIRHPIHCALILFAAGAFLKQVNIMNAVLFIIAIVFVFLSARADEDESLEKLGNEYSLYIKTTKKFIPRLY